MKVARLASIALASVVGILAVFVALQFARERLPDRRARSPVCSGYTIVSYNRLAALVIGVMHYVYQGKGAYLVAFSLPKTIDLVGLRRSNGIAQFLRPLALRVRLNGSASRPELITLTGQASFGYLFSDLALVDASLYGWLAGIFAGYLWSRFRAGATFGLVFYPWMAFWVLFWFGWNLLFDARGVVLDRNQPVTRPLRQALPPPGVGSQSAGRRPKVQLGSDTTG